MTLSPRRAFARLRANIEARRAFDAAEVELTQDMTPCGCDTGACGPTYRSPSRCPRGGTHAWPHHPEIDGPFCLKCGAPPGA